MIPGQDTYRIRARRPGAKGTAAPGAPQPAPEGAAPGATPAPVAAAPMQTFAQMQRAGLPRPSPMPMPSAMRPAPSAPGAPAPTPTFQAPQSPLGPSVQQAMADQLARPTGFDDAAVQRAFQALSEQVDDDYTTRNRQIDEEMARRGLYASSIAGGRLADSNLARRSAKEGIARDLLTEQARGLAGARSQAIAQALGADQQAFGQAADVYGLNRSAGQQDFANMLEALGLGESMYRGDRDYGLATDRQALETELGRGELGLRRELGRGELGLARDRHGLEAELGRGELGLRGRQLDADIEGNREDRALRRELGLGELGLNRDRFGLDRELGLGGLDLERNEQAMRGLQQLMELLAGTNLFTDEIEWDYDKDTHRYVPGEGAPGRGYRETADRAPAPARTSLPAGAAPWGSPRRRPPEDEALEMLLGGRMPVLY